MPDSVTPHSEMLIVPPETNVKSGIKTSEGQLTIVTVVGAVIAALAPLDHVVQVVVLICAAVVASVYIVSRSLVKRSALAYQPEPLEATTFERPA